MRIIAMRGVGARGRVWTMLAMLLGMVLIALGVAAEMALAACWLARRA
jgi:hypothetical protein